MSQISCISSLEGVLLGESDQGTSLYSQCHSSSSSILATAVHTETDKQALTSLGTGWTDSKHSSYLNFMEAAFVKNMYGSGYCAEDVCGKSSYHVHGHVDVENESDESSAESQLQISFETTEVKICEHGDWTLRPVLRSKAPAGIPGILLTNPWIKHFRSKTLSSMPSTCRPTKKGNVRNMGSSSQKRHKHTFNRNSETKKRAALSDRQVPVIRQKREKGGIST